jgi:hypothetical protein
LQEKQFQSSEPHKFRRELVMALAGDFCQGCASTRGRTSTSDNERDWMECCMWLSHIQWKKAKIA